jgi:hypothetical protein
MEPPTTLRYEDSVCRHLTERRCVVTLIFAVLLGGAVAHAVPGPRAKDARRLADARAQLLSSVVALSADLHAPKPRAQAKRAMRQIDGVLDRYFHGSDLQSPAVRPHALAVRPELGQCMEGAQQVLLFHDDALRYRPEIRDILSAAAVAQGDHKAAAAHIRAAMAAGGDVPARRTALARACAAAGEIACTR